MKLNHIRYGNEQPLLLIHGLGGSWKSWMPVLDRLAKHREIIAVDLPGHGKTPRLDGPTTLPLSLIHSQILYNEMVSQVLIQ